MFSLSPKNDKFYTMFIENAEIIYQTSKMLTGYVNDLTDSEEKLKVIKDMEHKGDQQQHTILNELNSTFITPFDREDIYAIAKRLDNVIDYMEASASRFVMFNVDTATKHAKVLCELIEKCCKEIIPLMQEFEHAKKSTKLQDIIININKLEEEGDLAFRKAVRELFTEEIPVLEVIKWREIYQYLEKTIDACESVANIIEGVAMKNA
ncbi:MAG: DUF47 domain-containing protein [Bacillota bacterium]|nr:DUF47 domain-containing protein [Bacillota bacterium]